MGHHSGAKIVYGYPLGDSLNGWEFEQTNEDEEPAFPWHADGEDFCDSLDTALKTAGIKGVSTVMYAYEGSGVFLATVTSASVDSSCDWSKRFDATLMGLTGHYWDAVLKQAIDALGITPTDPRPGWHLVASYG
jgi:hypothetical protein